MSGQPACRWRTKPSIPRSSISTAIAVSSKPISRSKASSTRSPSHLLIRSAKSRVTSDAAIATVTASSHSTRRWGARDTSSTTVAIAAGPAIDGIASGTMSGSPEGVSPKMPSRLRKIIRSAIRNKIIPPARLSERSDSPKRSRRALPNITNTISTASAIAHSRAITRKRRAGLTCRSSETNNGMLPIGSVTSSRITTAEANEISTGCPPSTDRQCDDAQRHRRGRGDAARHIAILQPVRSHQRREQNADLARRRDVADRGKHHRRQHQDVGKRAEQRHQDNSLALPRPRGPHLLAAPQCERRHDDDPAEIRAPVEENRRYQRGAHRLLVHHRIERDHAAGEQCERDSAQRSRCAQPRRARREKKRAADHQRRAGERHNTRTLAEQRHRDRHRQERAGRPRERIDDREVAMAIAAVEQQIVCGVEHGAREDEGERRRRELEVLNDDDGEGERRIGQGGEHGERPDEADSAAALLENIIPARVDRRSAEHEGDGEAGHGTSRAKRSRNVKSPGAVALPPLFHKEAEDRVSTYPL